MEDQAAISILRFFVRLHFSNHKSLDILTIFSSESQANPPTSLSWLVTAFPHALSESNIFYFTIYNGSVKGDVDSFNSDYFSITSTAISSYNKSSSLADLISSSSLPITNESTEPVSTIDLPVGAEVGIGLAIGTVSCSMVLAVALLFRCIQRRNRGHLARELPRKDGSANVEDSPEIRGPSWTEVLEMQQNIPNGEHRYDPSQYRWVGPGDVALRYPPHATHDRRRSQRSESDESTIEDPGEAMQNQDIQQTSPFPYEHDTPSRETPTYTSHHDSYASWTQPSNISRAPTYASRYSRRHDLNTSPTSHTSIYSSTSTPHQSISHYHSEPIPPSPQIHQPIPIPIPIPIYDPWQHHEIPQRNDSRGSIQSTPDKEEYCSRRRVSLPMKTNTEMTTPKTKIDRKERDNTPNMESERKNGYEKTETTKKENEETKVAPVRTGKSNPKSKQQNQHKSLPPTPQPRSSSNKPITNIITLPQATYQARLSLVSHPRPHSHSHSNSHPHPLSYHPTSPQQQYPRTPNSFIAELEGSHSDGKYP